MEKYFDVLRKCSLFDGIEDDNVEGLLGCLKADLKKYDKGEIVFSEGQYVDKFGIVLDGNVQIVRVDYYGNKSIVANVLCSEIFGESFACAKTKALPVDVIAAEKSTVLLLDANKIAGSCGNACEFHSRLIYNLLYTVARKNLLFHRKIEITSKRTTRDKLMTYLMVTAKEYGKNSFQIPYDRQELADYLEVDRSGLSVQIGKLCDEGFIKCTKNMFSIL